MKSVRFYLEHIQEQTRYLLETADGLTKDDFLNNRTLILAFERSLEIIGEAAGKVDEEFRVAHPDIPWQQIRGLRNIVAHMYWAVDYDIIWHVVQHDIPRLHDQLEVLLA